MALFDTPNLLGKIFEKQTFPEGGGGFAGLLGGITGGVAAGQNYKNTAPGDRSFAGAMQEAAARGSENSAEISQPMHPVQRRVFNQNMMMNQLRVQGMILSRDNAIKAQVGMAEIGRALAEGSFDDPNTLQQALSIAAKYGIEQDVLDPVMRRFNSAQEYKQRSSLMESEYKYRMELAEKEAQARIDRDAASQQAITDRERMRQDEMNRRHDEKLKAAKEAYQARLDYLRQAGKNDPMLDAKERLFSAKAQAITRDVWTDDTAEQVQAKIDKAFNEVFGAQAQPAAAATTNAPATNRKKYNPETGLLE